MMRNLFVCVVGLALGLGGCGSVTAAPDPTPDAPMTVEQCATYCGCAAPKTTPAPGTGTCVCVQPSDAGSAFPGADCSCAGWAQTSDSGAIAEAALWSPAAACASFNQ